MATSFAQDLGPTPTPVSVNEPIVNKGIATAITGLGNAAHLQIANDTEDQLAALRSRGRPDQSLTPKELEAIDYPKLAAGLEQGVLGQDEFQARLDTNLRRMYALNPGRAKAYASFAGGVRATLTPAGADKIDTPEEAIRAGQLEGLQKAAAERTALSQKLQLPEDATGGLIARKVQQDLEKEWVAYKEATGHYEGAQQMQKGFDILPSWMTDGLTYITGVAAQNGGTIPPAQLGVTKARVLAGLDSNWNAFSAKLPPGSDVAALRTAFDQQRSGMSTLVDMLDASKVTEGEKNVVFNMLATRGAQVLTDVFMMNQAGGQEAVKTYFQTQTDPNLVDQIKANNPAFAAYSAKIGKDPGAAWRDIAIKLGRGTPVTSLPKDERDVVGQGGVNAIASPAFNNKKDEVLIPRATELVKSGDIGIVKAWFTPDGLAKLRATGETGDYYRKQYQSMIDSVVASTITELADMNGTLGVSATNEFGKLEYNPASPLSSAKLAGEQLLGLGKAPIQRKIEILNEYADKTPNLVLGGLGTKAEARNKILEDINKRLTTIKAGGTKAPDTTTQTPAPSGGVIKVDDNGVVIP